MLLSLGCRILTLLFWGRCGWPVEIGFVTTCASPCSLILLRLLRHAFLLLIFKMAYFDSLCGCFALMSIVMIAAAFKVFFLFVQVLLDKATLVRNRFIRIKTELDIRIRLRWLFSTAFFTALLIVSLGRNGSFGVSIHATAICRWLSKRWSFENIVNDIGIFGPWEIQLTFLTARFLISLATTFIAVYARLASSSSSFVMRHQSAIILIRLIHKQRSWWQGWIVDLILSHKLLQIDAFYNG